MSFRPGSSTGRPGSAARGKPLGTAAGRPPGTATRLTTGMAPPGTGRPGTRGGAGPGGVTLGSQVQVVERPMTQQGLGGPKTAAGRGPQRQVQDKTYFVALLRGRINELSAEIHNLSKEIENIQEDQSSFVTYEKRAEQLAAELKEHQAELADYNTLLDKMNTDDSIGDIQMEFEDVRVQNDREAKTLDTLFEQKQQKDNQVKQLEIELEQEKRMADNMVADMHPDMRGKYMNLKQTNEHHLRKLESSQQTIDELTVKRTELDEELAVSPVKQEAVRLYEQLHELEEKRDELLKEAQTRGTPQEEREKLLKQVKEDNQEIASMDRQTNELREKSESLQNEINQLDQDLEENQGEKNQKYKELKKREETMNDFLENFEDTKSQEKERLQQLEANIVLILEHMSRNLSRFQHLPSASELGEMKSDLKFKETEMKKSEGTASGLAVESERLAGDLQKVEQLEGKITSELDQLKSKIDKMTSELEVYSDLDKLKSDAEARKQQLGEDKVNLHKRKETFKKTTQQLAAEYEGVQAQLNENETHVQLGNLERKWQHHEQNNFVMKEYIATKAKECDYHGLSKQVTNIMDEYNQMLQKTISGKSNISDA